MREIRSPLDGIPSPFAARAALDAYLVGAYSPKVVADFSGVYSSGEYYRTGGSTSTFSDMFTHARASNATMVDSDGLLKWAPHNLIGYSEEFNNIAWVGSSSSTQTDVETAPNGTLTADRYTFTAGTWYKQQNHSIIAGVSYTISIWLKSVSGTQTIRLYGSNTQVGPNITLTESWQKFSHTFTAISTGNLGAGVARDTSDSAADFYLWGAHVYRSDLGGMVNNPDTASSYVPTTSSAVYLPRRNHYGWNGSSYVNKGLLLETEARTNLLTYSDDFSNANWLTSGTSITSDSATGPDGNTSMDALVDSSGSGIYSIYRVASLSSATTYTASIFVKAAAQNCVYIQANSGGTPDAAFIGFNLSSGTVGSSQALAGSLTLTGNIENLGGGIYRCSATWTTTSAAGNEVYFGASSSTTSRTYTGTAAAAIYIYGAQLEAGSTPSSYIPTNGATDTRALETLTIPAAKMAWPTPNVIGPELVTNGTFDDASWWGTDPSWTIAGGVATVTGNDQLYSPLSWVPSAVPVLIQFDVTQVDTAGSLVVIATNPQNQLVSISSPGTYTAVAYFNTADRLRFGAGSGSTFRGSIDNVSVKEIDPLSVSLQMQGEMTYADTNASSEVMPYQWYKDFNNRIQHYMPTSTGTGQPIFLQGASGVFDSVSASANYYSPDVNVPFNIASRHGSTFINGAVDGTALTANTTPTALPDLSTTDFKLGYDYMGTIALFREDNNDWGDAGIAEAST